MRISKGVPTSDDEKASETVRDNSRTKPGGDDADFLIEAFDVPPHEAAALVGGDDQEKRRVVEDEVRGRPRDGTGDEAPLPEGDVDDVVPDNDEVAEKPVLRDDNRRTGAG